MYSRIRSALLVGTGLVLGILLTLSGSNSPALAQPGGCQSFPQTGHQICGRFLDYWNTHGGLAQQGYPLSEEFTETSDLTGKPYTVQYFERAVFELHPENQPPYDVLLTLLGSYYGGRNYPQGFPAAAGVVPYYDNRLDPGGALKAYYNAVNRKEYQRAYSYFQGAPNPAPDLAPPYPQFAAGYADTASVALWTGQITIGAAAGNLYASVPVVLKATHTNGTTQTFAGCYTLHRVNVGVSCNPEDINWNISGASLALAPANANVDQLLAQHCGP